MSDATVYTTTPGTVLRQGDGTVDYAATSPFGAEVILYADHLASLERVRVETLREVWTVVDREQAWSLSAARMQIKCLAAIDRLIAATTTGPCPGPGGGAHDRNHINSDGDPCCSKCGDNATTTGDTDATR